MLPDGSRSRVAAKRPLIAWDVAISVVALTITGMTVALGVFGAVFLIAFLDYCPPQNCSTSGALVSVGGSVVVAFAAGLGGLVVSVLRILDRRTSWPFSVVTLLVCATAIGVGMIRYLDAVGY
ncbi:hypothetical protein EV383_4028 [Pseudonocardia sediminis]|uniref:PI-PLC Y-box domain-containing protein n=1 Tax=Pseudonocardia sediminis TaxID=1397368 RepID=A0A4V2FR38_PSEST|nr:hypothetical protein [Pseudonocardia sediminis]RZT87120.1 hypothetical protein EV383_4028 [Pseudonocardia sediminis]